MPIICTGLRADGGAPLDEIGYWRLCLPRGQTAAIFATGATGNGRERRFLGTPRGLSPFPVVARPSQAFRGLCARMSRDREHPRSAMECDPGAIRGRFRSSYLLRPRRYMKTPRAPLGRALRIARREPLFADSTALAHQPEACKGCSRSDIKEVCPGTEPRSLGADHEVQYTPLNSSIPIVGGMSRQFTKTARIPDVLAVEAQFSPSVIICSRGASMTYPRRDPRPQSCRRVVARPEPPVTPTPEIAKSPVRTVLRTASRAVRAAGIPDRDIWPRPMGSVQGDHPPPVGPPVVR